MSTKDDLLTIGLIVAGGAAALFYLEYRYQEAGGATGIAAAGADVAFNSLSGWWANLMSSDAPPADPGMGSIPDQNTLTPSNATSSSTINSLLNSSLTMQSIGM
jgi:hypothetical protein